MSSRLRESGVDLYVSNALPLMSRIEDCKVAFTFYDPPYNVGKEYDGYDDDLSPEEYYDWMSKIAAEARRISSRGFAVYVGGLQTQLFFSIMPDAHLIPVHKRAIGIMSGNYFLQYHSLFVVGKPLIKCKDLWDDIRLPGEGYFFREERFDHPGQTATALVRKVLYHFTDEGDTVFDPFMGVGATAVAAVQMKRKVIGCDQSVKYIEVAKERVARELRQIALPL